ncbi:hypothetical protein [Pendulispora albinea]|uniref:Peptidase C1A papain C-terminal domain-containing protein n=1 Tax=Pendulispora albinea TaxID=2741071 RepID=A0ABZ2LW36_9BACT
MKHRSRAVRAMAAGLCAYVLFGCDQTRGEQAGSSSGSIVDVPHTAVERQSIGNCWLYAEASWIESMHLSATGERFDTSQSYWTYWHWFDQIVDGSASQVRTGGNEAIADRIVARRGLVRAADFVSTDTNGEMSAQQKLALDTVNAELSRGRLATRSARANRTLVRRVLDEAWALTSPTRDWLDGAFGADAARPLGNGANLAGTPVVSPGAFLVRYTERVTDSNRGTVKDTALSSAMGEWSTVYYPSGSTDRRNFLIRVQRALHDRQPVILTWNVDFNALESGDGPRRGAFDMTTLRASGRPGSQGGHMVVLEDYQASTQSFGVLAAGVTLDPNDAGDRAKLDAALLPSTQIQFLRIKNSWGTARADRGTVPGFPGYHDLYMDYLNGPIAWCPDVDNPSAWNCRGSIVPLNYVVLPPGY